MKILILCTGNSCRSQMAEGILKFINPEFEVYSAGTNPKDKINPNTFRVMKEIGIDISAQYPKNVDEFIHTPFDYVITVCNNARESCPVFYGKVGKMLHMGFEDPADATGTEEEVLNVYRDVRNKIFKDFRAMEFHS
jgi:arsenate reductase (thioredoxin)